MKSPCLVPILFLLIFIVPSTAVTITERPDTVANGQPMYITIRDLPKDSHFSLLVEAACQVQPDSEFQFQMSQFVMPFSLSESSITATLSGTSTNRMEVMKESTIVTVSGKSTDGHFTTTKHYDITSGTYDYFRLSGTSLPTSNRITAQIQVAGTTQGPDDSEISFVVDGLTTGTITTAVLVDGSQVLYKTVPVGGAGYPSSGSGSTGISDAATSPPPEQWHTFTSADGLASITVSQVESVGFLKVPASNVIPGMMVLSGPYSLVPQDSPFQPPATLQFQIPEGTDLSGLAIVSFTGQTWTPLPSRIQNSTMSAAIESSGTYALFAPAGPPASAPPATTAVTKTPITTATPTAPPTTKAGIASFTLILALGIGCLAMLPEKR